MRTDDWDLLHEYARRGSEEAFATLVSRHVNLVYSVALRQVRSAHLAEEVAQSVFIDVARNAGRLKPDTIMAAWLYRVAYRTAIDVVRSESRRQFREQKAMEMAAMNSVSSDWSLIAPLLDEGMETLDETDRSAILLRYFENKSLREVGASAAPSNACANFSRNAASLSGRADSSSSSPPTRSRPRPLDWLPRFHQPRLLPEQLSPPSQPQPSPKPLP